jgi:hypothetical protein
MQRQCYTRPPSFYSSRNRGTHHEVIRRHLPGSNAKLRRALLRKQALVAEAVVSFKLTQQPYVAGHAQGFVSRISHPSAVSIVNKNCVFAPARGGQEDKLIS